MYPQQFKLDELQPLLRSQPTIDALKRGQAPVWDLREFMKRRAKYLMYP